MDKPCVTSCVTCMAKILSHPVSPTQRTRLDDPTDYKSCCTGSWGSALVVGPFAACRPFLFICLTPPLEGSVCEVVSVFCSPVCILILTFHLLPWTGGSFGCRVTCPWQSSFPRHPSTQDFSGLQPSEAGPCLCLPSHACKTH